MVGRGEFFQPEAGCLAGVAEAVVRGQNHQDVHEASPCRVGHAAHFTCHARASQATACCRTGSLFLADAMLRRGGRRRSSCERNSHEIAIEFDLRRRAARLCWSGCGPRPPPSSFPTRQKLPVPWSKTCN
ncbi:hypothetical protein FKQ53_16595 [Pandoraea pnomenusa]|nr:hypothetical protein FKQ53_16595 [Pandoraea pnomenusa]